MEEIRVTVVKFPDRKNLMLRINERTSPIGDISNIEHTPPDAIQSEWTLP